MRRATAACLLLPLLWTAGPGCTRDDKSKPAPPPAAAPVPTAPSTPAAPVAETPKPPPSAAPARVPSFAREIQPYLAMRCANDYGCHGIRKTRHASIDLRTGQAYRTLVNVLSDERSGAMLIQPGNPDKSFLVDKLLGRGLSKSEGSAMPRDPEDNRAVSPIPYDPDFIDNALVPWIRAGAPNN